MYIGKKYPLDKISKYQQILALTFDHKGVKSHLAPLAIDIDIKRLVQLPVFNKCVSKSDFYDSVA